MRYKSVDTILYSYTDVYVKIKKYFFISLCKTFPPVWTTYDILTYLLTPLNRVLLEKLSSFQLVKKFPTFYGTRSFITSFTSARHLSLSRASSIQSITPHSTS